MTPTQRSLKKLRDAGWTVAVVERWNPHAKVRQDLFGMFDLLCFRGTITMGLQVTTGQNVSKRLSKILANPLSKLWLVPIFRTIVIHGWRKVGPRGKRKTWECREVTI